MPDIAAAVPVFTRTDKLETFLKSAESVGIDKVYVADDGESSRQRDAMYSKDWGFELEVFDLPFDAGVGKKHRVLSTEPTEDYLLCADSDMQLPHNYHVLKKQLEARPNVGGICGMYLEPGRIRTVAGDIYEEDGVICRDIREKKDIEMVANSPFVEFDFLPQAGLFRTACFDDYTWDPEYTIMREHIDFFFGHWKQTDWTFALSPEVYFRHNPGGDHEFLEHRYSNKKHESSDSYFCDKWGCDRVTVGANSYIETYNPEQKGFMPPSRSKQFLRKVREDGVLEASRAVFHFLRKR